MGTVLLYAISWHLLINFCVALPAPNIASRIALFFIFPAGDYLPFPGLFPPLNEKRTCSDLCFKASWDDYFLIDIWIVLVSHHLQCAIVFK